MINSSEDSERKYLRSRAVELSQPVIDDDMDQNASVITMEPFSSSQNSNHLLQEDPRPPEIERDREDRRRPIPISTIDWRSRSDLQFIASTGLDFLRNVEQLYIQQTIELVDLLGNQESENRYTVRVPRGETLYYGCETSSSLQRSWCGSNRAFSMRLFDQTQQEALQLKRRIACGLCGIWCYLQHMEVWLTPGELLGTISQKFSLTAPSFVVTNRVGTIIFRIEGPTGIGCWTMNKEAHFKIFSADGQTQLGSINHHWDQMYASYNLGLQFPNRNDDNKHKALLLGAAFLLEYMFFVNVKKSGRCLC